MKEDVLKVKLIVHDKIEELRLQMQKIALDKELTDPKVVSISERLDLLINEFYLAKKRYSLSS
ncbi:MAG: sporulation protein Spo0E [Desulfosporosinus sp. BRH_c37]|nr:MAG: sporulation protein Spo0E [Desulfosporosinus sp. BRH_c37]